MTDNREAWLIKAAEALEEILAAVGEKVVPMRISVGWPGGRSPKNTIGQCWSRAASEDEVSQIFLSPIRGVSSTVDVLGTLLHEMIHAIDDCESGHRGNFSRIARSVGFIKKLTVSDFRSEELNAQLEEIAERIGLFPHAALVTRSRGSEEKKKQGTRMLKVVCPEDGYTLRTTQKWIDVGLPTCPCGVEMEAS